MPPLIVTLAMDGTSQALLNALRQRHFPPERNFLAAHITLFHALDGVRQAEIISDVTAAVGAPFPVLAQGLRSLGRGGAISIQSAELLALRARLATSWAGMLTAQDRQPYRPHVTIQNKVSASEARALLLEWEPAFTPFGIKAVGLSIWRYLGGPWEPVATVPFVSGRPH